MELLVTHFELRKVFQVIKNKEDWEKLVIKLKWLLNKIFIGVKHTFCHTSPTKSWRVDCQCPLHFTTLHVLGASRWHFFITVEGIIKTIYCALDVQLHEIQNHLKSKLNEQQAALELLKKQHDRERVRCGFEIILILK